MLTERDLAVLEAALMFFDEEMTPHGPAASAPYFGRTMVPPLGRDEVRRLRQRLRFLDLSYLCYEANTGRITSAFLFADAADAKASTRNSSALVGTVLLISRKRRSF